MRPALQAMAASQYHKVDTGGMQVFNLLGKLRLVRCDGVRRYMDLQNFTHPTGFAGPLEGALAALEARRIVAVLALAVITSCTGSVRTDPTNGL